MKIESLKIHRIDNVYDVQINESNIERILDYKISSSADGTTELDLKIDISDAFIEFVKSSS